MTTCDQKDGGNENRMNGISELRARDSPHLYLDTVEVTDSSSVGPTILSTTSGSPCGPEVRQNSHFRPGFVTKCDQARAVKAALAQPEKGTAT